MKTETQKALKKDNVLLLVPLQIFAVSSSDFHQFFSLFGTLSWDFFSYSFRLSLLLQVSRQMGDREGGREDEFKQKSGRKRRLEHRRECELEQKGTEREGREGEMKARRTNPTLRYYEMPGILAWASNVSAVFSPAMTFLLCCISVLLGQGSSHPPTHASSISSSTTTHVLLTSSNTRCALIISSSTTSYARPILFSTTSNISISSFFIRLFLKDRVLKSDILCIRVL